MSRLKCVLFTHLGINRKLQTEFKTRPCPSMNSVHSYERNCSVCNCKDCVQALFLSLCLCISICEVLLFKSKQSVNSYLFTILSLRAGFPCGSRDLPAYLHNMFSSHLLALSKHKLITKQSPKFLLGVHLVLG